MKLSEGVKGRSYLVKDLQALPSINRRLEALGVNADTRVILTNRKKTGTVIIKVRGTWLALGQKIAGSIEVEPEENASPLTGKVAALEENASPLTGKEAAHE